MLLELEAALDVRCHIGSATRLLTRVCNRVRHRRRTLHELLRLRVPRMLLRRCGFRQLLRLYGRVWLLRLCMCRELLRLRRLYACRGLLRLRRVCASRKSLSRSVRD